MPGFTKLWGAVLACAMAGGLHAEQGVARGLNAFSASIYEELAKGGAGNLAVSPYSIANALSMALAGARGGTAEEMAKVLGQSAVDAKYHAEAAALVEAIRKAGNTGGNRFLDANALWVQKGFRILPEFTRTLGSAYGVAPVAVDFSGSGREQINEWTAERTQGRIRDLFAPGSLNNRTVLVLSSATYFYGKWERAFRRADTKVEPFHPAAGEPVESPFMHQTARFGYAATEGGQVLEMRYAGSGFAFDILLPKPGADAGSIDLKAENLAGWLGTIAPREVQVAIPKFRVESAFPLASTLTRLGMGTAFSSRADFSGIDDRRDLQLSTVVHKAYVDVTEEGTEAAAATGIGVALISAQIAPPVTVFRADRPFVFLIRDTKTGLILFAGRVANPKG